MPNTRETVRALVSAFNVNNHFSNTVETNFTLQSDGNIAVSFDKGMDRYQCSRYLDSIKRKIIREFYGIEESNDAEILDTAKLIFDVNSFPFDMSKGELLGDEQNGFKFVTPADEGVISNLKSHLAFSLKKDVQEDMSTYITPQPFDKKKYLWHGKFPNKQSRKEFEREFLSKMENRYGYRNVFKNPLKIEGNSVYIKDVFDDARFIDSVIRYKTWLEGMYLGVDSSTNHRVKLFKDMIIESIGQSTVVTIYGFMCTSPLNRKEASILIPIMQSCRGAKLLTKEEASDINRAFNYTVLNDFYGRTQAGLSMDGSSEMYSINFSDPEISHCVITKIIESSVINKDHELSIDPERVLSPAQSPFNSPTHAGPSGLRTPPNQRKEDGESGYESNNSPPKPKDSGAQSQVGMSNGPSSDLTELPSLPQRLPTRSQNVALKRSARQGSEKEGEGLCNHVGVPGTSGGPGPSTSSQSLGAAQNMPAAWTQNPWPSPPPAHENKWMPSTQFTVPGGLSWTQSSSGLSSRPSPPPAHENKWTTSTQFTVPGDSSLPQSGPSSWPSPPPAHENKWMPSLPFTKQGSSDLSWKGAAQNVQVGPSAWSQPIGFWSSPAPSAEPSLWQPSRSSSSKGDNKWRISDKPLTTEEEKLNKALLYWFNLNNYALDPPHTNFIEKNGKIASVIDDGVDVKEYLQEIIDKTKEEYRVNKEEAYDFNEFPFQFLSNCEKNQETTVVANISRGALLNLKELFSREHEGKVEIKDIDINIVEKAVKSEKDKWVNFQVQEHGLSPKKAITTCYPDESVLEDISITKDKGGYWINRGYNGSEVKLFRGERWPAQDKSKAEKMKPEDNKDSGYSSGFVTDAENVSSKAEATTSGYESMDCENTRGGSPKRSLELNMENLAISTTLNAPQPSPAKKLRSNEVSNPLL